MWKSLRVEVAEIVDTILKSEENTWFTLAIFRRNSAPVSALGRSPTISPDTTVEGRRKGEKRRQKNSKQNFTRICMAMNRRRMLLSICRASGTVEGRRKGGKRRQKNSKQNFTRICMAMNRRRMLLSICRASRSEEHTSEL